MQNDSVTNNVFFSADSGRCTQKSNVAYPTEDEKKPLETVEI